MEFELEKLLSSTKKRLMQFETTRIEALIIKGAKLLLCFDVTDEVTKIVYTRIVYTIQLAVRVEPEVFNQQKPYSE